MNYLQLVQQCLLLARVGEDRLSAPLATFSGATGPVYEVIQWIAQADVDLQLHRSGWSFMRGSADLALPSGASTLVPALSQSTIRSVIPAEDAGGRKSIGLYATSIRDESRVTMVPYEMWYGNHMPRGGQLASGRPGRYTDNGGTLMFDAVAAGNYHITFDYLRQPQRMAVISDESLIPTEHRMAIVWWALLRFYCLTRDTATKEFRAKVREEYDRALNRMYNTLLPPITTG